MTDDCGTPMRKRDRGWHPLWKTAESGFTFRHGRLSRPSRL